jgi:hypothetical protein
MRGGPRKAMRSGPRAGFNFHPHGVFKKYKLCLASHQHNRRVDEEVEMVLDGGQQDFRAPAALAREESLPVPVLNRRLGGLNNRSGRFAEEKNLLLLQVVQLAV